MKSITSKSIVKAGRTSSSNQGRFHLQCSEGPGVKLEDSSASQTSTLGISISFQAALETQMLKENNILNISGELVKT